jgi:hypothetical protein
MKVRELLEMLQQFDPDNLVVVDGYEDGVTKPFNQVEVKVLLNVHDEDYYGPHEIALPGDPRESVKAVLLKRPIRYE